MLSVFEINFSICYGGKGHRELHGDDFCNRKTVTLSWLPLQTTHFALPSLAEVSGPVELQHKTQKHIFLAQKSELESSITTRMKPFVPLDTRVNTTQKSLSACLHLPHFKDQVVIFSQFSQLLSK